MFALIVIFTICLISFRFLQSNLNKKKLNGIPIDGPKGLPIFGLAFSFIFKDSVEILNNIVQYLNDWKGLARGNALHRKYIFVAIPEDIEIILTDSRFFQKADDYDLLNPWLHGGLLTETDKTRYQKMRKLYTPTFHFKILEDFVATFDYHVMILCDILAKNHGDSQPFDFSVYTSPFLFDAVCETSFGVFAKTSDSAPEFAKYLQELNQIILWRGLFFLGREEWFWKLCPKKKRQDYLISQMQRVSSEIIEKKRKQKLDKPEKCNETEVNDLGQKKRKAFLDVLLDASIDGKPLTTEEIQQHVNNILSAAHDTIKAAIEFTLFNLAKFSDVQQKVYDEIIQIVGSNRSASITLEKVNDLKYLDLVFKESLRMYPPIPMIGRSCNVDVEINGKIYPANHNVMMSIYFMHRSEKYFVEPLTFKPERFLEQRSHGKSNIFSYIPFSSGPRNCIGQKFAQYEIKTVIARLVQAFEISLGYEGFEPELGVNTVLITNNGIQLKLKKRAEYWNETV